MPVIAIDPEGYEAASAIVGHDLGGGVTSAYAALTAALFATDAMAGHDEAGRSWGSGYDSAVQLVAEGIASLQRACVRLGAMLQHTGFNHCLAEAHSELAHSSDIRDGVDNSLAPPLNARPGDVDPATGGSGDYPSGWSLVHSLVGFDWPDGQPARLREAATAWKTAGRTLGSLTALIDDALASIARQESPEVFDATIVCRSMRTHLDSVARACTELGTSCVVYAEVIDTVHQQCTSMLSDLVSDIDRAHLIALLFAGETEGGSEGVALEYDASRVLAVATKIAGHLAGFTSGVAEIVAVQDTAGRETSEVTQALQPILGNPTPTANTIIAAGGPAAAAHNDEVIATRRLNMATGGVSGRTLWTSWSNYPKVDRHGRDYALVGDRLYSHHAVDRLQPSGLGSPSGAIGSGRSVSPTFIDDILTCTQPISVTGPRGEPRLSYSSGTVQVITENGIVVTVITR